MKILVVDDSATMRRIVIRALGEIGYRDVVEADNGQTALRAFQKGDVDMIITDWNMPVMSGLDLVTEVRQAAPAVPILMVTTNASSQDVVQALQAGVTNYVVKPFSAETFKEKVEAVLAD